ncbi:NifU homolog involved in Fe-S cluster formation [Aliiroseovarius halocynthiae]|uniref:Iron-sulfur cluster assembly scaffold protein n=1 Tax=Aliiroseovarius halocynthiae TaxID=985055 RepID=A0A545SX67_9RHOB|nr:iron-sulfur cluster assembly scaffold protein [Aliiroseovarius halocynthiae]TQV69562.1 iron-sulfur cluster assembly scaffold protein [Aliiroseovarius halocynthiae]SMR71845.1 NifU homolog involved in Fe-S cluster formation [Aliiroseovarius halocynthiae]
MSDTDLIKLYSKQILSLAATIPHQAPLEAPQGEAKVRSPLCGSTVTAALTLEGDRISGFSQNVKACALGQASASILGKVVVGLDRPTLERGRDELKTMLKDAGHVPTDPFHGYEVLQPARDFKNRHASILLAFDAAIGAFDDAKANA